MLNPIIIRIASCNRIENSSLGSALSSSTHVSACFVPQRNGQRMVRWESPYHPCVQGSRPRPPWVLLLPLAAKSSCRQQHPRNTYQENLSIWVWPAPSTHCGQGFRRHRELSLGLGQEATDASNPSTVWAWRSGPVLETLGAGERHFQPFGCHSSVPQNFPTHPWTHLCRPLFSVPCLWGQFQR